MLAKSRTLTSGLKAQRIVSNPRLIYSFVVVIFHELKRLMGITMEDNKPLNNKQPNAQFHNLVWLSREMNKNFNVDGIIRLIEDINLGVKELSAKR
ncbi:MAG: hypothetical protein E6004_00165 [Haemophilus parainfluenzae]|nr:hypothetical protein [Haemophilus parainfluenzae]